MKKKILMLNYEFPPLGGGGGIASYKLAKGFTSLGYKVDLITGRVRGLKNFEVVDDIAIYRVLTFGRKNRATATFISMLSYVIFATIKGIKLCLTNKYVFINAHFAIPTGPVGLVLSKMFKIKSILSLHGGDIYDPSKKSSPHSHWYWRTIVSLVLNHYDFLVAQSNNTKKNAIKYFNPQKKIYVIPLPYERIKFSQVSREKLDMKKYIFYLISVGRLVERKGFKYLIRALSFLPEKIQLNLIGDGPLEIPLKNLTKELGLEKRVNFLGFVSEEKKFQYLNCSDLYVLPSLHEGFGIVLQEAMQVGLPIVATNNGGQTDFLIEKENALLVKPKSTKQLAGAILKIYHSRRLRKQMREKNLRKINLFSPKKIAGAYLNLLKSSQ